MNGFAINGCPIKVVMADRTLEGYAKLQAQGQQPVQPKEVQVQPQNQPVVKPSTIDTSTNPKSVKTCYTIEVKAFMVYGINFVLEILLILMVLFQ